MRSVHFPRLVWCTVLSMPTEHAANGSPMVEELRMTLWLVQCACGRPTLSSATNELHVGQRSLYTHLHH